MRPFRREGQAEIDPNYTSTLQPRFELLTLSQHSPLFPLRVMAPCRVCKQEFGKLLSCVSCPDVFHYSCAGVKKRNINEAAWECNACRSDSDGEGNNDEEDPYALAIVEPEPEVPKDPYGEIILFATDLVQKSIKEVVKILNAENTKVLARSIPHEEHERALPANRNAAEAEARKRVAKMEAQLTDLKKKTDRWGSLGYGMQMIGAEAIANAILGSYHAEDERVANEQRIKSALSALGEGGERSGKRARTGVE